MILGLEGWATAVLIRKIPWGWHPRAETRRRSIHVINCILLGAFFVDILIILIGLFLFPSLLVSSYLAFYTYFILSNCLFFPFFFFFTFYLFPSLYFYFAAFISFFLFQGLLKLWIYSIHLLNFPVFWKKTPCFWESSSAVSKHICFFFIWVKQSCFFLPSGVISLS